MGDVKVNSSLGSQWKGRRSQELEDHAKAMKANGQGAALKDLKMRPVHDVGGHKNNRAENPHLPIRRRERKAQKFRSIKTAQKKLSSYGQIYNLFY